MGTLLDIETHGGGRVVINVDSLNLEGSNKHINADGFPLQNVSRIARNGGSGGYIYIRTNQRLSKNQISSSTLITANGGFGVANGLGGSGGVIILDGITMPLESFQTRPG